MTRAIFEVALRRLMESGDALKADHSTANLATYAMRAAEASCAFGELQLAIAEAARKADLRRRERS